MPPAEGYFAPSFANEYPCSPAMQPASTNESHTAAPATSPAAPSSEKMPAPTMAPTPMNAASRTVKCLAGGVAAEGVDPLGVATAGPSPWFIGSPIGRHGTGLGHMTLLRAVDRDPEQQRAAGEEE